MKKKYGVLGGRTIKGDVDSIGSRLAAIAKRNKGELRPHDVLDDARKKSSPLHKNFEWDDTKAAEQHRLFQARYLIGSVVEINIHTQQAVRSFVNVTTVFDEEGTAIRNRSYAPIDDAMADPAMRRKVLQNVKTQMTSILRKHQDLEELANVYEAVEAIPA